MHQSISILSVVGWYFFTLIQILKEHSVQANSGDPDLMPHFASSDLGLNCLHMFHKKDDRLIWV